MGRHGHAQGGLPRPSRRARDARPSLRLEGEEGFKPYEYPLEQRAATLWYHDHRMDFSAPQVWRGLAGMFLVHDDEEDALPLPGGDKDVPLMLCDRSFEADGSFPLSGEVPGLRGRTGRGRGVHGRRARRRPARQRRTVAVPRRGEHPLPVPSAQRGAPLPARHAPPAFDRRLPTRSDPGLPRSFANHWTTPSSGSVTGRSAKARSYCGSWVDALRRLGQQLVTVSSVNSA
ncbi:multicopper oxidase domain-containing protein [Streptomyces lateritius]|uniref:multicopper oxidase domain-containing protein n=1 Tax=Streptomyces lateritius TaxID=67313 RepID=UPI0027E3E8DB|nr:multicopper oxidase domain-containing protein [Streptomyces lateritius]